MCTLEGTFARGSFTPAAKSLEELSVELEIKPTGWRLLRVKKAG